VGYLGAIIPTYDPSRAQVNITSPDRFSGDGSTLAFTLTYNVSFTTDLEVFVDGVQQEPNEAYGVSGKTLTFTGAPGVGTNNIYVVYRAAAFNNYAVVPDGSITYAKLANNIRMFTEDIFTANGTGSTFTLTETPASANTVLVHIDGVLQSAPTNYNISGTTLTFTSAPDASSKVVVKHLGFRTTTTLQSVAGITGTLANTNGGTGVTSTTGTGSAVLNTAPTLSLPVIDNIKQGYSNTATAATTTTLTVNSNYYQRFVGVTTQTVVLPVTSTLTAGMAFEIENQSTGNLTVQSSGGNTVITVISGVTVQCKCIGTTLTTAADWDAEYNEFNSITGTGAVTLNTAPTLSVLTLAAGTATAATAPLKLTSGTNLTSAEAGVVEYDGSNFYLTSDTTHGRNVSLSAQQFQLSTAGSAIGPASNNYFGATSAASLAASSTYDIEAYCYFLKTTAGTLTWAPTFSSAATVAHAIFDSTPITGFTTTNISGAMVTAQATQQTVGTMTFAATGSLTTAVYHIAKFTIRATTNAACNFRLNVTNSAGTITPQAGSFYTVRRVVNNAGTFAA